MSEFINNHSARQEQLKQLIRQIHDGLPLIEAKAIFKKQFGGITTEEIVELEQALISEGMKVEEVQRLCDVHAALFDGSIEDIHKPQDPTMIPGHPAQVFLEENRYAKKILEGEIEPYLQKMDDHSYFLLRLGIDRLMGIEKHYTRKEYLIFPLLEKRGITSIPQVMWGVDNEIRAKLKEAKAALESKETDESDARESALAAITDVKDMITKEVNILIPKLVETFTYYDWVKIQMGSNEFEYFLDTPIDKWDAKNEDDDEEKDDEERTLVTTLRSNEDISFDAGHLSSTEINAILNTVPFDMTFVDKDGHVKYFTQGKERIFHRPLSVIGRHVSMCHPPKSVHIVEDIVESFKTGRKEHEDFHIRMKDMFVHIRYYAVRGPEGEYLGTLEVTQDIQPLRDLTGEKRLVSE